MRRQLLCTFSKAEDREAWGERVEADPRAILAGMFKFIMRLNTSLNISLLTCHAFDHVKVPAWWCRNDTVCWERIVDKWFDPEWQEKRDAGRQRRLLMPGPAHHQGSLNNDEYRARWVHRFISLF